MPLPPPAYPLTPPVQVGLLTGIDLVRSGVTAMLGPYGDRFAVRELSPADHDVAGLAVVVSDAAVVAEGGARLVGRWQDAGCHVLVFALPDQPTATVKHPGVEELPWTVSADAIAARLSAAPRPRNGTSNGTGDRTGRTTPALSTRETEVMRLIAAGHTNEEVAAALHLSPNTVKTHVRSAYRKAGVTRRSQAVAWCIRHGMTDV